MRNLSSSQSLFLSVLMGFLLTLPVALWLRDRAAGPPGEQGAVGQMDEAPGLKPGESATSTTLKDLQGEAVDLLKAEEGYLVLSFFAAEGCPKCTEEAPVWKRLITEGPRRNARTFLIAADKDLATVRQFVDAQGFGDLPVLYDPTGKVMKHFKVRILPQYLLFDRTGKVVHREIGYSNAQGIGPEKRAQAILGAIPPAKTASSSTGARP